MLLKGVTKRKNRIHRRYAFYKWNIDVVKKFTKPCTKSKPFLQRLVSISYPYRFCNEIFLWKIKPTVLVAFFKMKIAETCPQFQKVISFSCKVIYTLNCIGQKLSPHLPEFQILYLTLISVHRNEQK
jgi:hypothetical protein